MLLNTRVTALLLFTAALASLSSCRKKPDPVAGPNSGSLKMEFTNQMDGVGLQLGNTWYKNANGDSFTVSILRYYISNISLTTSDGQVYTEPESYHLIDQDKPESRKFTMSEVPFGRYTTVKFMIGVDSARNVSGAQTGALDQANNMFWTWNSGYIMAKMEGTSPKSTDPNHNLFFHIGGFKGATASQRWVTLTLPGTAEVRADGTPNMHVFANLAEWFRTPSIIDFSRNSVVMNAGGVATTIADNYVDMFVVDHIDN